MSEIDANNTDDLPSEILSYCRRKATAQSSSRRNAAATTDRSFDQRFNKLLLDQTMRMRKVRQHIPGIGEDEVVAIVANCFGRPLQDIYDHILQRTTLRTMEADKQRAIAEARAETQQKANEQIIQVYTTLQQLVDRVAERLEIAAPFVATAIVDETKTDRSAH